MSTDLLFMPAVQAAALIRARKLSPVDYVDAVLTAIEHAQPRINCFRVVMAEEARRDAKKAEEAVSRGDKLGPLHDVPVSVGKWGAETDVLRLGALLERARPWAQHRPPALK